VTVFLNVMPYSLVDRYQCCVDVCGNFRSVMPSCRGCFNSITPLRFEVLIAVNIKITVFWDVTGCSLVDGYQCCVGICGNVKCVMSSCRGRLNSMASLRSEDRTAVSTKNVIIFCDVILC
jgi:hypothetical protein